MKSEYQDAGENKTPHNIDSMDALLSEHSPQDMMPNPGDMREGTIVRITPAEILVDIGAKSEGVLNQRELADMDDAALAALELDKRVSVCVEGEEDGTLVVSFKKAEEMVAWQQVQQFQKDKSVQTGSITGYNRGGLMVDLGPLHGFLPASQVSRERRQRAVGDTAGDRWGAMIGEEATVKVIEADQTRERLIVSERAAFREDRAARKGQLLSELEPGQIRKGRVTSLASFGAFVDVGGVDGLIHVSELGWRHINHPSEVVKIGQEIEVQVLSVDSERQRIALSSKALEPNPWVEVSKSYQEGQLVLGVITRLTKFGAFASIEGNDSVEGLVHISEMSDRHVGHPEEVVEQGEQLTLRIIQIDTQKQRLRLSIKAVASDRYAELDYTFHVAAEEKHQIHSEEPTTATDSENINAPPDS